MIKSLYKKIVSEKTRIAFHYALYKFEAFWLRGDRYECCCCGKSSRRFLAHGNLAKRPNIKCPHCLSLERTRILCMYIQNIVFKEHPQPLRVLHFAPVKGLKDFLRNSPQVTEYIDADINPNVATCRVYGRNIVQILGQYGFKSRIIDYVKQLPPDFVERNA